MVSWFHFQISRRFLDVDVIKFAAFKAGGSGDWEEDRAIREFPKVDYAWSDAASCELM